MKIIDQIYGHNIPSIVCKYFTINNDLYNSLKDSYLWFSNPLEFNDPYDCNLLFDINNTEAEIKTFIIREKLKKLKSGNSSELFRSTDKIIKDYIKNPESLKVYLHNFVQNKMIPNHGICCFSENPLDLLMWSHYADKHKGLCILYDLEKDIKFFSFPIKVDYPDHYPKFNYIRNSFNLSHSIVQFIFGTKSKEYSHETEIRVIKEKRNINNFRGKVPIKRDAIVEVIFGYKTDKTDKNRLFELMKSTGYNPMFSDAILKPDDFGLTKKACESFR
jgi:hypothetical protein